MSNYSVELQVFNAAGEPLNLQVSSIKYTYDESLKDTSKVVIQGDTDSIVDNIYIQEDRAIFISWGYIGIATSYTKRKVYIIDSDCDFNSEGVTLTLSCLPKAAYLKHNSKKTVRNDATLPDVISDMASVYGLDFENSIDQDNGLTVVKTGFSKPGEYTYDRYYNSQDPNDPRNGELLIRGITSASDSARVRLDYVWKSYSALPQANKSDAQLLEEMRGSEPLDNLVMSGRDDSITLKTRDFNQAPIRAYVWYGGDGELLEVRTGINNRFNRSESTLNTVEGWNAESKTHITGDIKSSLSSETMLADNLPLAIEDILQSDEPSYPGNVQYYGLFEEYEQSDDEGNTQSSFIRNEELNGERKFVFRERKGTVPGVFNKDGYLLEQDVVSRIGLNGIIPVRFGKSRLSIEDNPRDTAGYGINKSTDKSLELNKSKAKVIGSPELHEGKIIDIQGIGKKYSGKWYILKAEHSVNDQGWLVDMDITKNARGSVDEDLDSMASYEELNREINEAELEDGNYQSIPEIYE
jgi:hypothetical protein